MDRTPLDQPRFLTRKPMLLAGLSESCTVETSARTSGQWQRFMPFMGLLPRQIGGIAYGIRHNGDEAGNFDYVTGVEVPDFEGLPDELIRLSIPEQRYAIFVHRDAAAGVGRTIDAILAGWLPQSGHQLADGPILERYDSSFEARISSGGMEVWLPVLDLVPRT